MNRVFLLSAVLILFFVFSGMTVSITGMIIGDAEVGIKETLLGKITGLDYKYNLNITELQNITAEFTNVGSVPFTSRIEITIYFYNNTKLEPIAYYYDSYKNLLPIQKGIFKVSLLPPYYGTYYIKIRVPYETKVAETWGVFSVSYVVPQPEPIIVVVPPGDGTWTYERGPGISRLTASYQRNYSFNPGQTVMININATNTGETSLSSIRLSTSSSNAMTTDVNPKVFVGLAPEESTMFLVSLTMPKEMEPGLYPLGFELISDKARESGSIMLNITNAEISIKEDVFNTILNYQYLLGDLEGKISDADSKGLDVSQANISFNRAQRGLQSAREYYNSGKYQEARDELDGVRQDLEDVVFQLANAALNLYVTPAFSPFILVIIMIFLGILFFILLRRRKRDRKPRLLREASSET
jgi:hypothetical protein